MSMTLFCVSFLFAYINAELFTSSAHLQTALYAEQDIAAHLHSYVEKEQLRLDRIKRLADDYEAHSIKALNNIDHYLGNPVNAFLLIKRFTLDWDRDVDPVLLNTSFQVMNDEILQARTDLPSYEDLKGAVSALMRLQDTYQLDTSQIAHGNLRGVRSPILTAEECFEIGRMSYNEGDFYHTRLWMEAALTAHEKELNTDVHSHKFVIDQTEDDEEIYRDRAEVLDYLAFSQYKLGNVKEALSLTDELLRIEPTHQRATNNKKYFEAMITEQGEQADTEEKKPGYQLNRDEYRNSWEFLTYEALCRGEQTQPIKDEHKLTCQYVTKKNPLLLIQPAKEETVHLDPWVVVYHDVFSDADISQIKHLATPKLNRATVQNSKTGELETANYRISKSAWLKEEDHDVVKRVNAKMTAITGLELGTAEELQIANYGLGGHYEPHFDFARREEKDAFKSLGTGNRIATFLNYMSDVEAGGATVFPYIGLKLFPKKGNAAFWYNLNKNGEGIYNTRHAACPVLVGTKWVANKWIHERGQEFKRPCSLNKDE